MMTGCTVSVGVQINAAELTNQIAVLATNVCSCSPVQWTDGSQIHSLVFGWKRLISSMFVLLCACVLLVYGQISV